MSIGAIEVETLAGKERYQAKQEAMLGLDGLDAILDRYVFSGRLQWFHIA